LRGFKGMFILSDQTCAMPPEHAHLSNTLHERLTHERRKRLAAERMLELKKRELSEANRKLGQHAKDLTNEIVETRAQVETIRGENQRFRSDLTAANQRIEITERRLWLSIQTIHDGFALYNADDRLVMANKAYMSAFDGLEVISPGVKYGTILQVMTDEGIVDPEGLSPQQWRAMMTERFREKNPKPVVLRFWNEQYIKIIDRRGPEGDMVSLSLNITESVRHAEELEQARQEAEAATRAKSAFLANMSHEIRTPMNGVVGMADVLMESELTEEQSLYAQTIKNSGEALLVIINDVLDYSKIEAQKLELHHEAFDLREAMESVVMLMTPLTRDKGLEIALDYDLSLPTHLTGDAGRLRQVMNNLLGNAVKFTAEGHILARITGRADTQSGTASVTMAVQDTGIGIPEDKIDHIFGEFNQVENERNRQFDGTGLGLSITKRLVDLMGGSLKVTSRENEGSCFEFTIQMDLVDGHPAGLPSGIEHLGPAMVVDVPSLGRDVLADQLARLGLAVDVAKSAEEAAALMTPQHALVLTHHMAPDLDARAVAAQANALDVPVVLAQGAQARGFTEEELAQFSTVAPCPLPRDIVLGRLQAALDFPKNASVAAAPLRKLRLLAAEDNKTNQLVFRKMIKALNLDLQIANNGEEAVALFGTFAPDLVFMDISMPVMDGMEATRAIRQTDADVPIIAMTAHAMTGDDKSILEAGLSHYMTKPLRKPEILAHITEVWTPDMAPLQEEEGPAQAVG